MPSRRRSVGELGHRADVALPRRAFADLTINPRMHLARHRQTLTFAAALVHPTDDALHDETSEVPDGHWDIFCQHVQSCVANAPVPMQHTPPAGLLQAATAFVTELPRAAQVHVSNEIWSHAGWTHVHPAVLGHPFCAQHKPAPTLAAEHEDVVSPPHVSEWLQVQSVESPPQ